MLIIRLVMVHMGPKHTQYGQKTARLAPVLQNGLKGHVRPPSRVYVDHNQGTRHHDAGYFAKTAHPSARGHAFGVRDQHRRSAPALEHAQANFLAVVSRLNEPTSNHDS